MMPLKQTVTLLQAAIEASVYVAPTEPGLTIAELFEVAKRLGLREGEINDAMPQVATQQFGMRDQRLLLPEHFWTMSGYLIYRENPDLRNPKAFDFVVTQLNELARDVGAANASLSRGIILARGDEQSIPRHDLEVAIALMLLSDQLLEEGELIRFSIQQSGPRHLPSEPLNQPGASQTKRDKTARTQALPHVKDVIARRADGRPKSAEPIEAFAEQLQRLGYGHFRLWWTQAVRELERSDPTTSPLSTLVLAAALVEGTLTFVVRDARTKGLGVFGSTSFNNDPKTWRVDELVASAARGGGSAILDMQTKNRVDGLIVTRQRIHAGRMLSDFPNGVPDLRPEEAREAKAIAEQVVRRVLDWIEKYRPAVETLSKP